MKKVTKDVVYKRKNEKDKKNKIFLDTLLENKDVFPTDDEVCSKLYKHSGSFKALSYLKLIVKVTE